MPLIAEERSISKIVMTNQLDGEVTVWMQLYTQERCRRPKIKTQAKFDSCARVCLPLQSDPSDS